MTRTYLLRPGRPSPTAWGPLAPLALGPAGSQEEVVAWDPPTTSATSFGAASPSAATGPTSTCAAMATDHRHAGGRLRRDRPGHGPALRFVLGRMTAGFAGRVCRYAERRWSLDGDPVQRLRLRVPGVHGLEDVDQDLAHNQFRNHLWLAGMMYQGAPPSSLGDGIAVRRSGIGPVPLREVGPAELPPASRPVDPLLETLPLLLVEMCRKKFHHRRPPVGEQTFEVVDLPVPGPATRPAPPDGPPGHQDVLVVRTVEDPDLSRPGHLAWTRHRKSWQSSSPVGCLNDATRAPWGLMPTKRS